MAKSIKALTDLKPQAKNANKHTERGLGVLRDSLQRDGWIGAMTVAADGETFDGSARLEVGVDAGFDDAILVESDGTRPVIVKRTDIPNTDHEKAKRLGIAANRVAQLDLAWDGDVLAQLESEGDLLSGLFSADELLAELNQRGEPDDPNELWQGMPEFEHKDKTAFRSLTVHFKDQEKVDQFAALIAQKITPQTRFLWFPTIEIETYRDKAYEPES